MRNRANRWIAKPHTPVLIPVNGECRDNGPEAISRRGRTPSKRGVPTDLESGETDPAAIEFGPESVGELPIETEVTNGPN